MSFRQIITELRESQEPRLTQSELGKELKITQRKVSYLEKGVTEPSLDDIIAYCKYFNVSADYILGLTKDKSKNW